MMTPTALDRILRRAHAEWDRNYDPAKLTSDDVDPYAQASADRKALLALLAQRGVAVDSAIAARDQNYGTAGLGGGSAAERLLYAQAHQDCRVLLAELERLSLEWLCSSPPVQGAATPDLRRDVLQLAALARDGDELEFGGEACRFAVGIVGGLCAELAPDQQARWRALATELVEALCAGLPPDQQARWQTLRASLAQQHAEPT